MSISVVLVRPQLALNIGAVARVMSNTGFADLRLVLPKQNHLSDEVLDISTHAKDILKNAKVYKSLGEAVADADFVVMTTARNRDVVKVEITPAEISDEMHKFSRSCIVFGPERTGVTNEELVLANRTVTIPSHGNSSYNLSHAAAIILYLISAKNSSQNTKKYSGSRVASSAELQNFMDVIEGILLDIEYFKEENKKKRQIINIKNIFTKNIFSKQDIQTLTGVVKRLKSYKKQ